MWIKYTGKLPYNSTELRGVPPEGKVDVKESLAKKLIKKRPKWFKTCSAPAAVKPKEESKAEEKVESKSDKDTSEKSRR